MASPSPKALHKAGLLGCGSSGTFKAGTLGVMSALV